MSITPLPDMFRIKRVLIIRLSAIGDVVHALPIASALKIAYPHLEISWLVEEISAQIVQGNPYLHQVFVVPRSKWNQGRLYSPAVWREYLVFLQQLRREEFDLTIDLQGYAKSAIFALSTGAAYKFGWWRLKDGSNLISKALPKRESSLHRVDWFLDVARGLGVENPVVKFPIHIPDEASHQVEKWLSEARIQKDAAYAVINPTAGNSTRMWGKDKYSQLVAWMTAELSLPCILIGTKNEYEFCQDIIDSAKQTLEIGAPVLESRLLNFAGKTSLKELAALLKGSVLHLCGDTGSTHIAAGLGTPVVSFYGASDPNHAGPWCQLNNVLAKRDLCHEQCNVRQCYWSQNDSTSPLTHLPNAKCMEAITVEEAKVQVRSALAKSSTSQEMIS